MARLGAFALLSETPMVSHACAADRGTLPRLVGAKIRPTPLVLFSCNPGHSRNLHIVVKSCMLDTKTRPSEDRVIDNQHQDSMKRHTATPSAPTRAFLRSSDCLSIETAQHLCTVNKI